MHSIQERNVPRAKATVSRLRRRNLAKKFLVTVTPLRGGRPAQVRLDTRMVEWQTRLAQTQLLARACEFKSHFEYQYIGRREMEEIPAGLTLSRKGYG